MSFKPGDNVGPYQVIEQLGQGGMATVFKAYHAALDRYVALKVLHQAFNEDSSFITRFQREARVVAKLEHPNIVPVYDYAEHEGRPYLVMKFIEGDTLKARMNRGPLTAAEIEQVLDSVGSALGYAHKQGVLHRDIKPSNVLISTDNVMYLADFGLARIAQAGESTLSSDSIMGTPQYISPEQAMGKKDLDGKTDIYSLGVMLYELVVGRVPFIADTPFSIIHDHIYTPLPLPQSINPDVPEPVQRVLLKALAKDRLDRYQTVDELIVAFKAAWAESGTQMQGTSIKMRPASMQDGGSAPKVEPVVKTQFAKSAQPKKGTSKWMWAVGGGLLLSLCCLFGFFALRNSDRLGGVGIFDDATITPFIDSPTLTPFIDPATQNATLLTPLVQGQPTSNLTTPTLLPPELLTPEIQAAKEQVRNNPSDPNAHLQLSLALWDNGQSGASYEALAQAANLAGPTNKDFYLNAAEDFKTRDAWIPAAGMYMRLAAIDRGDGIPPDVKEDLSEAVYKAAGEKDMPLVVFFDRIDAYELPLGHIVRGRYALYNGSVDEAKLQLVNAQRVKSDLYEAYLLKAEIEMKVGSLATAKTILISLSSDLGAAAWIREMAGELLTTIQ